MVEPMIAILGTGKMGEALLAGLLRAGRAPSEVAVVVRRAARGGELRAAYAGPGVAGGGGPPAARGDELRAPAGVPVVPAEGPAKTAAPLVVAVKPQDMGT